MSNQPNNNNINKTNQTTPSLFSIKCSISSFIATYISGLMHPFDLIKTRLQSHDGKSNTQNLVPKYSGTYNAIKQIYKHQGLFGLYKGFHISIFSQAVSVSLFFWMYEKRKLYYQQKNTLLNAVTYASIQASLFSTFITQPIWVIRTRMLLDVNKSISEYKNLLQKSSQIYQQNGLKGYCKGLFLSLILSFSGVVQMYFYQLSKSLYQSSHIPQSILQQKTFICGSISKIFSILLSYPITTVRTRIQQNQYFNNRNNAKYYNTYDIIIRIIKEEGIKGFYKGLTANLIRGIPQKGIYFYSYQILKKIMGIKDNPIIGKV